MDRTYGKALTIGITDIIDLIIPGVRFYAWVDHQLDIIDDHNLFFLFQLFQSQSQTGTASAKTFEDDPHIFSGIFCQQFPELVTGAICHRQHRLSPFLVKFYGWARHPIQLRSGKTAACSTVTP